MEENKHLNHPPRRGPIGRGKGPAEKPKDFKNAIKRLLKELSNFRVLIIISLILAIAGSVLSIMAPDKLKDMANEIQKGIIINQDNFKTIMTNLSNLQTGNISDYEIDGVTISVEDQIEVSKQMANLGDNSDPNELYKTIDKLPKSVQKVVKPKLDMNAIKKIAIILASMYIASAIFTFIQSIAMTDVANNFARKLRSSISIKINKLPLRYFDKHQTGDVLSRVTNDVDTIAQSTNQSLATLVSAVTLFLGTLFMMFKTNWILALTAIGASIIGFTFMFLILGKAQKYFSARQKELGNLNAHIEEIYSGLNVVKVYNGKKEADEKFDKYNKAVYDANRKSQFLGGLMPPLMNFIGNFGYVAVCVVGAILTMKDMISFGVIVAFITYVRLFTSPLSQIGQAMNLLQSSAAASERVFEFLDENEMSNQDKLTKFLDKDKVKGKIEFENVVFKYDGNEEPTIKGFTAKAEPGQKIAIVGPTGARKNYYGKFTYEIL